MAAPIIVPLSPYLTVSGNYTIRFTALDPNTGAVVTGVKVSLGAITGTDLASGLDSGFDVAPQSVQLIAGSAA